MKKIITILSLFISFSFVSCSSESGKAEEEGVTKEITKHRNGSIHKIARRKNKKLYGVQEEYSESGKLISSITYRNGLRDGEAIMYHDNGKPYRITTYKINKINGDRKKYRKSGKLWSVQKYKNGLPSCELKEYDESGKLDVAPTFIVSSKDQRKNKSLVELSVKGTYKKVEYYNGKLVDGKYFDKVSANKIQLKKKNKVKMLLDNVGGKPYNFIVKITTYANNNLYIYKQVK
jgi:uncharacterized protein YjhX (UPF0386 family)